MTILFKVQSQTDFGAVTLQEAKDQCRIVPGFTMDDTILTFIISAAADCAQEYLHWMVSPGVVKQYSPDHGDIILYGKFIGDITEVTAVKGGERVTLDAADYKFNDVTETITISSEYSDIFITYECGASIEQLPEAVKYAILMIIATMYNNREDFITGLSVEKMPMSSYKLLKKYRNYVS